MLSELRTFQENLKQLVKILPRPLSKPVRNTALKADAKDLVDSYFRSVRPLMISNGISLEQLNDLDPLMQEFLEFTHRRISGNKYKEHISKALKKTLVLEQLCLIGNRGNQNDVVNSIDQNIIRTLEALLPSSASSYKQALVDLKSNSRFSWRGPATDLRECLRETLDHLAPDADVMNQPSFKLDKDAKGPTMKQKVRFVLTRRGFSSGAAATTEDAVSSIDELLGRFVRSIYTRSNISTHTPTSKSEVLRVRDLVRVALCELLEIPT